MTSTASPEAVSSGLVALDPDIPEGDIAFVSDQIHQAQRREADQGPGAGGDDGHLKPTRRAERAAMMRPILWRLHFLGGFLAGPVILSLCISGILFAWYPQLDQLRFGSILGASSSEVNVSLADQVAAAEAAHPDWGVYSVVPGTDGTNTRVIMDPPGGSAGFRAPSDAESVYVDQATGEVTGTIDADATSSEWLRNLHSSFRLGPEAEPITELAGSWFLVSLFTGLYLWWPGLRKRGSMAFAARRGISGRRRDKDWHNFIGVGLLVPMVFLAVSGLTWTTFAGDRVDWAKGQLAVPADSGAEAALPSTAGDGAAGGAQDGAAQSDMANLDTAYAAVTERGMVAPVEIVVPADDTTGWVATSRDSTFPLERDEITVDGNTGAVTSSFDYADEHWFNKLRTAAILFHQAELFGLPLRLFMTGLALAVAYLVLLGYRMWWRRRPMGGMGTPPPVRHWLREAPVGVLVAAVVLGYLMPVLGLSLVVWLVLEAGWRWASSLRNPATSPEGPGRIGRAVSAVIIAVSGAAMITAPVPGSSADDAGTVVRALDWAWGRPLGTLFILVGLIGIIASVNGGDRQEEPEHLPA
ncbi:MAG: PepSY-associated TM helix domain-containing protein [Acidimicrobiales bacterium]